MKQIGLVVALCGIITLSSCKGDWNCTCDFNDGFQDTTIVVPFNGVTKADATDGCDAAQTTYQIVDPAATCVVSKQ
jgi:hypothetical protein